MQPVPVYNEEPGQVYNDDIAVAEALEAKTAAYEVYKEAKAVEVAATAAKERANEILNEASKAAARRSAAHTSAMIRAADAREEAEKAAQLTHALRLTAALPVGKPA